MTLYLTTAARNTIMDYFDATVVGAAAVLKIKDGSVPADANAAAGAGTGFTSTSTSGLNIVGTLGTNGISLGIPPYLVTRGRRTVLYSLSAVTRRTAPLGGERSMRRKDSQGIGDARSR